jgi:hypothetical protein
MGLLAPVSVIVGWPPANYIDPPTRSNAILVTACILGPLTLFIVSARLWARFIIQRNPGLDDYLIALALIPIAGLTATICFAISRLGFDRHIWDVRPDLFVPERKATFTSYLLYIVAGGLVKVSILLFYRRMNSRVVTRTFRIATWINIILIAMYVVSFILVLFLTCEPFTAFWDQFDLARVAQGYTYKCGVDEGADLLAASIISAVQDAVVAFLPTILYWNLQIPVRQKIALGAIFALGYVVVAIAALRAYYTWRTFHSSTYDITWESWPAWLLCMVEVQIGAICASAPALKVFLTYYSRVAAEKLSTPGRDDGAVMSALAWMKLSVTRSKQRSSGYLREPHGSECDGGIVLSSQGKSSFRSGEFTTI